jgi:hypothetical protein
MFIQYHAAAVTTSNLLTDSASVFERGKKHLISTKELI